MGAELASPMPQGDIGKAVFLTRPLWGLADTAPFLHDGRAPTLRDAIRWHGGEASTSRERFNELPEAGQHDILVFLLSLDREPSLFVP